MDKYKMLKSNATTIYNETKTALHEWKARSYFNSEKHQPKPYELFKTADKYQNHIIAVGDAETARCVTIITLCSEIFKIIT